jgi:ATP synthase protein I
LSANQLPPPWRKQRVKPASKAESPGWRIFSYMLSGMAVYGGIGWLIGRWAGYQAVLFPVGMVIGLGLAIVLIVIRYGRP